MPISVRWDNEQKTRIYYSFVGNWTWDEFDAVYADVYAMLNTVSHPVDAIVDLRDSQLLPQNTLTHMRRLTFQQHDNGGVTVFVTSNGFAHSLYTILTSVLRRARQIFRIAHTLEEAYAQLEECATLRHNEETITSP